MFILRIFAFFVLIAISMVGFLASLAKPILVIIPLVCVPFALYLVGYISRFSPIHAKVKNYKEEVELRKSPGYKYRRIFVGLVAVGLGGLMLYVQASSAKVQKEHILLGGLALLVMGLISIFGKKGGDAPIASAQVRDALIQEALSADDPMKRDKAARLLGQAWGLSQPQIDGTIAQGRAKAVVEAERIMQEVLDQTELTGESRSELEAEFRKVLDEAKKPDAG